MKRQTLSYVLMITAIVPLPPPGGSGTVFKSTVASEGVEERLENIYFIAEKDANDICFQGGLRTRIFKWLWGCSIKGDKAGKRNGLACVIMNRDLQQESVCESAIYPSCIPWGTLSDLIQHSVVVNIRPNGFTRTVFFFVVIVKYMNSKIKQNTYKTSTNTQN